MHVLVYTKYVQVYTMYIHACTSMCMYIHACTCTYIVCTLHTLRYTLLILYIGVCTMYILSYTWYVPLFSCTCYVPTNMQLSRHQQFGISWYFCIQGISNLVYTFIYIPCQDLSGLVQVYSFLGIKTSMHVFVLVYTLSIDVCTRKTENP